jgi:hypothetical protein
MAGQPERRCLPVEVEMIPLHRERRPPRSTRTSHRARRIGSWLAAAVHSAVRGALAPSRDATAATNPDGMSVPAPRA